LPPINDGIYTVGKSVAILGSTGSIGERTLDVIRSLGGDWRVVGLTAGSNWRGLIEQAREFTPRQIAIADAQHYGALRDALGNSSIEVLCGPEGVAEVASLAEAQFILCAIVGSASIEPTLSAARCGKDLGLASKEALVAAGKLLLDQARNSGARIIPVDSEHSAIFQALQSGKKEELSQIMLTASGGPFLDWPIEKIKKATPAHAMNHPTWSMGKKITIDSATMMNKGLELIEAHYLFGLSADRIRVVIHPESVVHSLVEFCDGVMIGQLSQPDMAIPIQYALTWPERKAAPASRLDLAALGRLTFMEPDREKFPALDLARQAARMEGSAPAVMSSANEQAVECFAQGRISFPEIVELTAEVLSRHDYNARPNLPELLEIDRWARNEVLRCLKR